MKKSPLRLVCIGAGYFSTFHVEAWKRLEGVELCAICDTDPGKARQLAKAYEVERVYTDYREMIEAEHPDFVDIITPPQTHLDICTYVAAKGIHMICQKPLAPSYKEAEEIVRRVGEYGVRFMVHENFRFQPWFREIKTQIDQGKIGDQMHMINFRFRTGDGWQKDAYMNRQAYFRQMPRLLVYETGIHYIDTFRYLGGEISQVYAKLKRWNAAIQGEDMAFVQVDFTSGALGLWDANRYNESNAEDPRYTFGTCFVEGNKGVIRLNHDGSLVYKPLGGAEEEIPYSPSKSNFAGDCVYATQAHFLAAFHKETPFETEADDYLTSLRIQEAVYRSSEMGSIEKILT